MPSAEFPPNPPAIDAGQTGWLEPFVAGVAEDCARRGATAAICAHRRLPTAAEARRGAEACDLAFQPDWDEHALSVLRDPARCFLAVCLKPDQALDDDPTKLFDALDGYWRRGEQLTTRRTAATRQQQFVAGLSTPMLLVLKAAMDALTAAEPHWDSV